jgi:hypothetical protein
MYLNFQQVFGKHLEGEKVVYFIFAANPDFFKFKNSDVNVGYITIIVEPCNKNLSIFSRRAQSLIGIVQAIRGRRDLYAYINNKYMEKSDLIYLPFFLRMRNYVKSSGYYGSEWVKEAVEKNSLCLHISAGTMGGKVLNSETVRLGNLAEFTF